MNRDAEPANSLCNQALVQHANHNVVKASTIHARKELPQHYLRAADLQSGDEMNNRDHLALPSFGSVEASTGGINDATGPIGFAQHRTGFLTVSIAAGWRRMLALGVGNTILYSLEG